MLSYHRGQPISTKSRSHLKIQAPQWWQEAKFHTDDPGILRATVYKISRRGFMHPCLTRYENPPVTDATVFGTSTELMFKYTLPKPWTVFETRVKDLERYFNLRRYVDELQEYLGQGAVGRRICIFLTLGRPRFESRSVEQTNSRYLRDTSRSFRQYFNLFTTLSNSVTAPSWQETQCSRSSWKLVGINNSPRVSSFWSGILKTVHCNSPQFTGLNVHFFQI